MMWPCLCACECVCVTTTWGFCAEFACILLLNECLDADGIHSEQLNGCNLSNVMYVCVYIVMLFPREKLYGARLYSLSTSST